jgi:hypothetical protein
MEFLKKKVTEWEIQEHVFFTGAVEKKNVLDYIDSFDIGLFSHSNAFGSPVVLFEMMALKKCIIAPSLKPFADVLTHGEHCLLFPPLDKNILLSHIESVITDIVKIREYGNRAFYHVMNNHTWEKNEYNPFIHLLLIFFKMSLSKKIFKNALANGTGFAVEAVIAVCRLPFIIHRIGESAYGVWVLVLSVTGYMGILNLGLGLLSINMWPNIML